MTSLVAAALAVGSPACSSDDDGSTQSPPPTESSASLSTDAAASSTTEATTTTTAAPLPAIAAGGTYVALGSSIASGFGISEQTTDCGRSSRSYPNLITARLDLALTDVTCGGATIPNVVDTAQGQHPPQIQALSADVDLVTVSIGGNDIAYNGTALGCSDPSSECTGPADLDARVAALGPALIAMIDAIRSAAPEAVVVFVTYPREIPDANCPELSLTDAERAIVADMGARLEQVFVELAERADVVFVDPYVEPGDHTGCAPPEDRWADGAVANDGFAFHPTALGHEVMAEMIIEALGG